MPVLIIYFTPWDNCRYGKGICWEKEDNWEA